MTSQSDQSYLMGVARLECAIANDIDSDEVYTYQSKKAKNTWYLLGPKKDNEKRKVYFKKVFNN